MGDWWCTEFEYTWWVWLRVDVEGVIRGEGVSEWLF